MFRFFKKTKIKIWEIGDIVKEIRLFDHQSNEFLFNENSSRKLLLSFFPLAWTKSSQQQIENLDRHISRFQRFNTTPVGICTDTMASIKAWVRTITIRNIRLLSDFWPHGYYTNKFGVIDPQKGYPQRSIIIIDEDKKIIFKKIYDISSNPDLEEIFDLLSKKN